MQMANFTCRGELVEVDRWILGKLVACPTASRPEARKIENRQICNERRELKKQLNFELLIGYLKLINNSPSSI
jgi:hypothetical protein